MIRSMTAFANAQVKSETGVLNIELKSVNNRYLDLNLRLPDELNSLEPVLRARICDAIKRGKVDVKLSYTCSRYIDNIKLHEHTLKTFKHLYEQAQASQIPSPAPSIMEMLSWQTQHCADQDNKRDWAPLLNEAVDLALKDFNANREREGRRLAQALLECANNMQMIITHLQEALPSLLRCQQERIHQKLLESIQAINPDGWTQITGEELSARLSQESHLFALRTDIAEELTRLCSHISELRSIIHGKELHNGKRLDFLCQEMHREANTMGSKAASMTQTKASMDLKILIDQIREQVQNIE